MIELLLIDDDEVDRLIIKRALGKAAFKARVTEAETAAEGLKLALKKNFDCVLLDYRLPDKNGLRVLNELFSKEREAIVPVIILTGQDDEKLAVKSFRAGAGDFINKDRLTPVLLERAIINAIERHKLILQNWAAQKKARHQAEFMKTIMDTMVDVLIVMDQKSTILSVNKTATKVTGYSEAELVGKPITFIMTKAVQKIYNKGFAIMLRRGKAKNIGLVEIAGVAKDGKKIDLELAVGVVDSDKEQGFVVGSLRVITERKKAEAAARETAEKLKQAQKMEAIGNLSGGIAHDFNNLLTAIQGSLQLMEMIETDISDDARKCLDIALQSTRRGADLTRRMLAFSRQQNLKPVVIEINNFLREFLPFLERTLGEAIEIKRFLMEKELFIEIDISQLENTLLNLALNSRDAMSGAGHLTFKITETEVTKLIAAQMEIEPGGYIILSVSDNGSGMSPKTQKQIFEPFFTTKEVGKGTGLGLSMVLGFIKQSGGHVAVYSELGKGTTFKLYLRKTQKTRKPVYKKHKHVGTTTKEEGIILLVEDNKEVLDFIGQALKTKGYIILKAEHGPAAVTIMEQSPTIDVLLTDVILPKGMDALAIVKKFEKTFPLGKIIYTSGLTRQALEKGNFLKKGEDFLSKPYNLDELYEKVSSKMQNKNPKKVLK